MNTESGEADSACRILLVIREAAERGRYRELLQGSPAARYQVTEASTAREAVAILTELQVDCVLLGAGLPDMDTEETLKKLVPSSLAPLPAVILLLPSERAGWAPRSLRLGAHDVLVQDHTLTSQSLGLAVSKSLARAKLAAADGGRLRELESAVEDLGSKISMRDEFLSIAAHELKTPIAAAKLKFQTSLRILAAPQGLSKDKLTQLLQDGDRQMSRLTRLIDNLLDLSRLESGQLTLHTQPTDLAALAREVVARFAQQFAYAGCPVELVAPAGLEGDWDADRLDQVLTNLLTNAIRYASGTPVRIELRREGASVEIRVSDGGPGVEPALREKIFERYKRVGAETRVRGLGLGLYITREIVNAHGGSVHVEGEAGEGARFVVRLPLKAG